MKMTDNLPKTEAEMSAELKSLQSKSLIGKILLIAGFVGAGIFVFFDTQVGIFASIGVAIIGCVIISNMGKKIKQIAGTGILKQVLEDVFENVDYRPFDRLGEREIDAADFGISYDKIEGNDYVRAVYHGVNIEMSDISLITVDTDSDGHTTESYQFRGLWMICDFGKELSADVRVRERSKLGKMLGKGGIKTENEAFNKQFHIRSANQEEAFYILTPHMMEYIVQMDEKAKARTNLSFLRGGKLHIALDSGRDAFEVKGSASDVAKIREQFTREIRQVTDLIDELRLVDTVFKA